MTGAEFRFVLIVSIGLVGLGAVQNSLALGIVGFCFIIAAVVIRSRAIVRNNKEKL